MKRIICLLIALLMSAAALADNYDYAGKLNELGLFNGTDKGYELDAPVTREQAATVLTRLIGGENEAVKAEYAAVFDDVPKDRWSFPYVMFCYENGISKGTGNHSFSPSDEISAGQFLTLVLRALGYETLPDTAFDTAVQKMLLTRAKADGMKNEAFTRGDMVYIMYRAMGVKTAGGEVFARVMADKGAITEEQAGELDPYAAYSLEEMIDIYLN